MTKVSPISSFFGYFANLRKEFGMKTILLTISLYAGVRGGVRTFGLQVALPFFKEGGWTGNELQLNSALTFVPWTLQGFVGILSDTLPIFGYYRTTYYFLFQLLTTFGMIGFIAFPMTVDNVHATIPMLLFTALEISTAWGVVLLIGKTTILMRRNPKNNGNIVTFSYLCTTIGSIFPAFAVGWLVTVMEVRYAFLVFLPFSLQSYIFIFTGCMIEDKCEPGKSNRFDLHRLNASWRMVVLAFVVAAAGTGSFFTGIFGSLTVRLVYFLVASIIVCVANFTLLPMIIAKANFYVFISLLSYINIAGAMEYYLTGDSLCVPDGPQFSYVYYRTWVSTVGIFAQLLACLIFQSVFVNWKYRTIFWCSTLLKVLASLVDFIIVMRWNKALGIDDEYIYMIGTGIIYEVTEMLDIMPVQLMCHRLAPSGSTGTMASTIGCFSNLGMSVNRTIGSWFMELFGIVALAEGPGCNFDNLASMIIVAHAIIPLAIVPLTFVCLPNMKVKQQFADDAFINGEYLIPQWAPPRNYDLQALANA